MHNFSRLTRKKEHLEDVSLNENILECILEQHGVYWTELAKL